MRFLQHRIIVIICIACFACQGKSEPLDTPAVEQWLTFAGKPGMPNIVLISGDEEYRSEEALPQLAKILSVQHGFNCIVLFAQDPKKPGIVNPNYVRNIPGLENLKTADLMIIFTRFRALPNEQMKYIDDYLKSGKPVIGMRTATHAFNFSRMDSASTFKNYGNGYGGNDAWKDGFGRLVLGEHWIAHHGKHKHQSTRGIAAPGMNKHAILNGIAPGQIWGSSDVYAVRLPLPGDAQPIVLGQVVNRAGAYMENDSLFGMRFTDKEAAAVETSKDKDGKEVKLNRNDPMMPVAWTKSYQIPEGKKGKVFTTTLGAATDLLTEGTPRMIVNSVFWCLDLKVPKKASVDLVGKYNPSPYSFKENQYWIDKNLSVLSLE